MFKQMKLRSLAVVAIASLTACSPNPKDDATKKQTNVAQENPIKVDTKDIDINKVSQALGHFIGKNLNTSGVQFDLESIVKGIRDGAAGKPAPMTEAEYEKAMADLQQRAFNAVAESNMEAAVKFMNDNSKEEGVVEIVPGKLQYKILQEGNGPTVPEHGSPMINYTGKYLNGTVFGSSEMAGGPITVPIDQTIPGFSKGIAGMKEGEKRRLFVHPEFGYGRSGQLPPDSLLIFDIEVIKAESTEKDEMDALSAAEGKDHDHDLDDELDAEETEEESKE